MRWGVSERFSNGRLLRLQTIRWRMLDLVMPSAQNSPDSCLDFDTWLQVNDVDHNKDLLNNCEANVSNNQVDIVDLDGLDKHLEMSNLIPESVPNTQYEEVFSVDQNFPNECGGSNGHESFSSNEYSSPGGRLYADNSLSAAVGSDTLSGPTSDKKEIKVIDSSNIDNSKGRWHDFPANHHLRWRFSLPSRFLRNRMTGIR
ncbi:hypothetical protein L2E82_10584 [Cichorium intybus]|uniref:Uncharacterized protein n=1 Tax=Cichorium intybus TaxID=13427 RepID=A0ACB9GB00_CICIN|nr:hypothetical protein L2E82_10584 [Cichorium intybus]